MTIETAMRKYFKSHPEEEERFEREYQQNLEKILGLVDRNIVPVEVNYVLMRNGLESLEAMCTYQDCTDCKFQHSSERCMTNILREAYDLLHMCKPRSCIEDMI